MAHFAGLFFRENGGRGVTVARVATGNDRGRRWVYDPMKSNIADLDRVLRAADEWVSALEALVATRQGCGDGEAEQEVLDIAGSQLVVAVTRWRSTRDLD
jgi:hypothetical protein